MSRSATWLDLKRQLVAQLVETSRLLRNHIDQRAKGRGTTRAQWIVLFRLRQQEGLSQVDLADVLELQPISLVRLLDRLVEYKLLERRSDPNDRRANRLFLTMKGRQLVDDLDSLRDEIAADVLRDIPKTAIESTLETLIEIKARIKEVPEVVLDIDPPKVRSARAVVKPQKAERWQSGVQRARLCPRRSPVSSSCFRAGFSS